MGVSMGRFHLEHAVPDIKNGDIKGSPTQVEYRNFALRPLVQAVGQGGCRGFVDNSQHIQAGNFPCIFCRLPLAVVKVGRHGDHRLGDFLTEILLRRFFEIGQNKRGYLGGTVMFVSQIDSHLTVAPPIDAIRENFGVFDNFRCIVPAADESFDAKYRVFRIGNGLAFGNLPHQTLTAVRHSHDGGGGAPPFPVCQNLGFTALHNRYA